VKKTKFELLKETQSGKFYLKDYYKITQKKLSRSANCKDLESKLLLEVQKFTVFTLKGVVEIQT